MKKIKILLIAILVLVLMVALNYYFSRLLICWVETDSSQSVKSAIYMSDLPLTIKKYPVDACYYGWSSLSQISGLLVATAFLFFITGWKLRDKKGPTDSQVENVAQAYYDKKYSSDYYRSLSEKLGDTINSQNKKLDKYIKSNRELRTQLDAKDKINAKLRSDLEKTSIICSNLKNK